MKKHSSSSESYFSHAAVSWSTDIISVELIWSLFTRAVNNVVITRWVNAFTTGNYVDVWLRMLT